MRISDWRSDVCSSDLPRIHRPLQPRRRMANFHEIKNHELGREARHQQARRNRAAAQDEEGTPGQIGAGERGLRRHTAGHQSGKTSWRERVSPVVEYWGVAELIKEKRTTDLHHT